VEKQGQGGDRFTESTSKTIVFEMAYFVVVTWLRDWNVTVRNQSRHYRQKTCEFNTHALHCCEKATDSVTFDCLRTDQLLWQKKMA
jgi:hypothetical protein